MPSVPLILQLRQRRAATHQSSTAGRLGLLLALLVSLSVAIGGLTLTLGYVYLVRDLPSPAVIPALIGAPNGQLLTPTRIYDRSGEHLLLTLDNPAATGRQYLALDDLPSEVISATLAADDPQFWQHPGFTYSSLLQNEPPTLAERLVSELLLADEPSGLRRDLRERLLAAQLTALYGRPQVLEWYLNSADYGRLAYGIDAAARVYFGKPAAELNLAEAALLAAIPDAPVINPIDTPQTSLERQQALLKNMETQGLATPAQVDKAAAAHLAIQPSLTWSDQIAPDFVQLALRQLASQMGWARLERGGLRILTSLDYDLQVQATCAARAELKHLGDLSAGEVAGPQAAAADCPAARLLPTLSLPQALDTGDLSANIVLFDPANGQILAYVIDAPSKAETALSPGRPPGTLLTPFVYLTSFTRGQSPASLVWDIPGGEGSLLADVPNLDGQYQGPLRLRNALANDDLSPALQTFFQAGSENIWRTARQLGLTSLVLADEQDGQKTLWEGGQANLLEMVQAYGTLANNGILVGQTPPKNSEENGPTLEPVTVLQVVNGSGEDLLADAAPNYRPVVSPQLAYLVTNILSDESARWRTLGHPNPLEIGRPVAVKLGQTVDGQDGWSVGYTPSLAAGVWIGSPTGNPENNLPETAAALWHAMIQYASQNQPAAGWQVPAGISSVEVCDPSGLLPTANCPNIVTEVFASGDEPTQADNLYRTLKINRESGLLATINTPPELVEEQVYLLVPPEAQEWAQQAGLPTPPEDYDIILPPVQSLGNLALTSPAPFAYVSGVVEINGTASGPGFDYYRLQAGPGLNPQNWLQIGEDQSRPVKNGLLGKWDTQGLNGLYVIQLLRVDQDQRIDSATLQVTVDNEAPQGSLTYPEDGQVFSYPQANPILFQVEASDNLEIDHVEFLVDGVSLGSSSQAPYSMPWEARLGTFSLSANIYDLAGNRTELNSQFSVQR
jgi:membrane peptidoglycan carboxypeptidase